VLNWDKICGNFLVAFCTAFAAAAWVGGVDALAVAVMNAGIFGALAVGKQLQEESPKKRPTLTKILDKAVLL
jgi:hypothetical protein